MTQYDNTNRGALFTNERKVAKNHPDYTGSINVGGVDYYISGWVKSRQNGPDFLSLSVTPKDGAGQGRSRNQPMANGPRTLGGSSNGTSGVPQQSSPGGQYSEEPPMDFDDDIPF